MIARRFLRVCRLLRILLILALSGCLRSARPEAFPAASISSPTIINATATTQPPSATPATSIQPSAPNPQPLTPSPQPPTSNPSPAEQPVTLIPLSGPAAAASAEFSGLAWYSDTLVLLPQYPSRFGSGDGALLGLSRADVLTFVNGVSLTPLEPFEIPFFAPGLANSISGYEGFESIAFAGDRVFLTIESSPDGMRGYLVGGTVGPGLSAIRLDTLHRTPIQPQTAIPNLSDEALLVAGRRLLTFYEANGQGVNPQPKAHLFDFFLQPQGELSFPTLEYRLTDVTPPDEQGRFWAINYFFPGDLALLPGMDPLAEEYGEGPSHARTIAVERLVEFGFSEDGLVRTGAPPIQLQLDPAVVSRNWEGIARLEGEGFLLISDSYPGSLLAFVPYPGE